jgi:hypothetical protein
LQYTPNKQPVRSDACRDATNHYVLCGLNRDYEASCQKRYSSDGDRWPGLFEQGLALSKWSLCLVR